MLTRAPLVLFPVICLIAADGGFRSARASAQAPEPTVTPVAHPAIVIHVINDVNGDGIRETTEPGLAGWSAIVGCSDAVVQFGPTDTRGEFRTLDANRELAAYATCIQVERRFGWLPTSPDRVEGLATPGATLDVTFLLHDMGRDAMEVSGEVIVAGLPPRHPRLALAPPYAACAGAVLSTTDAYTPATVIVSNGATHPGCPHDGQAVAVTADGLAAAAVPFASAASKTTSFVVNGDSMRIWACTCVEGQPDSAQIDGRACSVTLPSGGFAPDSGGLRIFVISDEVRPGCGAPERLVRFFSHGQSVDPLVPWRAGSVQEPIAFTAASLATGTAPLATSTPPTRVIAPDTGTRLASHDSAPRLLWALLSLGVALVCAGLAPLLIGGTAARRRARQEDDPASQERTL